MVGLEFRAKGCKHHPDEVKELFLGRGWRQDGVGP